ncbi:MAG: mevalonate kinase [Candidatus Altiarchaeales archaeon]|nr:mevalonate kinase [Candidatus Altiarchaeales archaeon]MBD3416161.1 mevalonate kinase [Candidatus Altiarchaeales archaeon]
MAEGYGYGKTILFGEHFVVYGLPAIASALGNKTTAVVEDAGKYELVDDRPATPQYKKEKYEEQVESNKLIFDACKVDVEKTPLKITLAGDLYAASGVGASAASAAAIARALNDHFQLGYDDKRINEVAYEGEKGYHGKPSGIDNTAAVYGGLIWFVKNLEGGANTMERLKMPEPTEIVLGNTGLTSSTKEVVGDVRANREAEPEKYKKIFDEYSEIVKSAREALTSGGLKAVGELMNRNHNLLQEITVSCKELDFLVELALDNGAYGAKLTGTGRGGLMQALTPGKELQDKVAAAMEKEGFTTFKTRIGV